MTPEFFSKTKRSLIKHEELKKFPYTDTKNKITIGIGYNLTDRGMPLDWITQQFQEDIDYLSQQISQYDWFTQQNDDRKIIILDMAFMGLKKLLGFTKMIAALRAHDYVMAAYEMLHSNWATEVGQRAIDLADAMREGIYNV